MPTTITAAVARAHKAPLTIETLNLDEIRPSEARVRLVATGVCHTDAVARDGIYPLPLPAVLGHEGAGVVEQVGASVTTVKAGDHVIMSAPIARTVCSADWAGSPIAKICSPKTSADDARGIRRPR